MATNNLRRIIDNAKFYEQETETEAGASTDEEKIKDVIQKGNTYRCGNDNTDVNDNNDNNENDDNDDSEDIEFTVSKKKRGRPKKNTPDNTIIKKKRGRKPKNETRIPILSNVKHDPEDNPLVLRLPIDIDIIDTNTNKDISENNCTDDNCKTAQPSTGKILAYSENSDDSDDLDDSYNGFGNCSKCSTHQKKLLEKENENMKLKHMLANYEKIIQSTTKIDFMGSRVTQCNLQFIDIESGQEILMDNTKIACFYDTCKFNGEPAFLPEYKISNKYYVRKCFCSWNCAMAYNFTLNDQNMWHRNKLIIEIYKHKFGTDDIKPADDREVLIKYGGTVDINTFRLNFMINLKKFRVVDPPMAILLPSIEERYIPKKK